MTRAEIKAELKKQGYTSSVSKQRDGKDAWIVRDITGDYIMSGQETSRVELFIADDDKKELWSSKMWIND